jgi:FAD/FMN-containing dehydrogenase
MSNTGISIPELRSVVSGEVIAPSDPEYEGARTLFYGGFDRRPAVVVRVADDDDVARVVATARESGLPLAVRSGGHSIAGHSVADGGIVLDLSGRKAIQVDPRTRTAWAETGLTAAEFSNATAEHGLAVGFGDTGSVGIGGITLGGGVGYLVRAHGLTIDDLLSADVVTADGALLRVDAESHPNLFWAIRGGGGNFGVATRLRFGLHDVERVVGGMLLLPATAETIHAFLSEADAAPDALSTIANVMPAPPMPFVPEEHHGALVIMALMCFAGDAESGEKALAPFRAIAEPIADMLQPIPYPQIYPPEEDDYHPTGVVHTMFVDGVDRAATETIVDRLEASSAPLRVAQIRVLGGAMAHVPNQATAFAHRDRRVMINVAALFEQPEERALHEAWVSEFAAALQRGPAGAYVNFLGDEGDARIREAYPGSTLARLQDVKARYDPANLFRLNQNVRPEGS